jgi:ribonuclease HI
VVISSDLSEVAYGAGPLLGWRQTVPLAELFAVKVALLCTKGDVTVIIDSIAVIRGIRRGPHYRHKRNSFHWRAFWEAVGDRTVTPIKIKSHLDRAEALNQGVLEQHWPANAAADAHAERAAAAAQLPAEDVEAVLATDAKARRVQ